MLDRHEHLFGKFFRFAFTFNELGILFAILGDSIRIDLAFRYVNIRRVFFRSICGFISVYESVFFGRLMLFIICINRCFLYNGEIFFREFFFSLFSCLVSLVSRIDSLIGVCQFFTFSCLIALIDSSGLVDNRFFALIVAVFCRVGVIDSRGGIVFTCLFDRHSALGGFSCLFLRRCSLLGFDRLGDLFCVGLRGLGCDDFLCGLRLILARQVLSEYGVSAGSHGGNHHDDRKRQSEYASPAGSAIQLTHTAFLSYYEL